MFALSACNSSEEEVDSTTLKDCRIITFSLENEEYPELSSTTFSIDQVEGQIFNVDSLSYGTVLTSKLLCSRTYGSGTQTVKVMPQATSETFLGSENDSIDFSEPVTFLTTCSDGITTKQYEAKVNIHQVDPDSLPWHRKVLPMDGLTITDQKFILSPFSNQENIVIMYAQTRTGYRYKTYTYDLETLSETSFDFPGKDLNLNSITIFGKDLYAIDGDHALYHTTDGVSWEKVETDFAVTSILGQIKESDKQTASLCCITTTDAEDSFTSLTANGIWTKGETVPADFPRKGFASYDFYRMYYNHLFAVGGIDDTGNVTNTAWFTLDGQQWVKTTDDETDYFTPRYDSDMIVYDGKLWLVGGFDEKGVALDEIYQSVDNGVSWEESSVKVTFPEDFKKRGQASLMVDDDNHILIIGGSSTPAGDWLNDAWSGKINRLGFK